MFSFHTNTLRMPREKQRQSRYCWLLPSPGSSWVCVCSLTPLSCLFLVSALPLRLWQGVEKLVHYFSDKAWYSTISDSPTTVLIVTLVFLFFPSLHDACQSLHEIIGMLQMAPFLSFFKMYLILIITLYVPRK